uniref:Uncharacterized protein n=1 Tax=Glossina austeni TaxID=7395 RepID=A0A1A9UPR6_GLOAU
MNLSCFGLLLHQAVCVNGKRRRMERVKAQKEIKSTTYADRGTIMLIEICRPYGRITSTAGDFCFPVPHIEKIMTYTIHNFSLHDEESCAKKTVGGEIQRKENIYQ